jgi:hypothetical protein
MVVGVGWALAVASYAWTWLWPAVASSSLAAAAKGPWPLWHRQTAALLGGKGTGGHGSPPNASRGTVVLRW